MKIINFRRDFLKNCSYNVYKIKLSYCFIITILSHKVSLGYQRLVLGNSSLCVSGRRRIKMRHPPYLPLLLRSVGLIFEFQVKMMIFGLHFLQRLPAFFDKIKTTCTPVWKHNKEINSGVPPTFRSIPVWWSVPITENFNGIRGSILWISIHCKGGLLKLQPKRDS